MQLQKLVDEINALSEITELNIQVFDGALWYVDGGDLCINTDENLDQLLYGEGETFCFEVRGKPCKSADGWVLFYDADNGCGTRDTLILRADKEVAV